MEYFDKQALDNRSIEWIGEQLDDYQGVVSDTAVLPRYRDFYSEVMQELLEYYWGRQDKEAKEKAKTLGQGEENWEEDLPF